MPKFRFLRVLQQLIHQVHTLRHDPVINRGHPGALASPHLRLVKNIARIQSPSRGLSDLTGTRRHVAPRILGEFLALMILLAIVDVTILLDASATTVQATYFHG